MHPSKRSVRLHCVATLAFAAALYPVAVRAGVARVELYPFASTTLTDEEVLVGKKEGKPVVLAGELRIPRPGTDRLAAVVLVHGSGGVSGYVDDWASKLNAMGIATFVVDSYTPRGITTASSDHGLLGSLAMAVDAYRALALVAKHPRIDPGRIGLMGFSFGGQAVLAAAMRRVAAVYGPGGPSVALYIALYPLCITSYLRDDEVLDGPIRIFHGADDDLAPVAACRDYVKRLQKAGKDVALTEYQGARHLFDWAALKDPTSLPQTQNMSECRIHEVSGGLLVNAETKRPFTYDDRCVKRGATLGYNAVAHEQTVKAVTNLLMTVLKGK